MNAKQKFLAEVLASGHSLGLISAADMLSYVTPEVLAEHLPQDLSASLLTASLKAAAMTPDVVVDTLGIPALAEHMPMEVLWGCIAEAGTGVVSKPAGSSKSRAKTAPAAPPAAAVPKSIPAPAKVKSTPAKSDTSTKVTAVAPEPDEPAELPAPPAPGGLANKSPAKAKASKSKSKATPKPKPNVRAKAKVDRSAPSKRSTLPTRSEFDVDTDVGEVWESDVEVEEFEIVDEADALGANPLDAGDWHSDEETKAGGSPVGRKR